MIQTEALKFQYKKSKHTFSFPDIVLAQNESLLILGKSGVGKTTLLHLLAGLLKPASGTIEIDTIDITKLPNRRLDQFRGKNIGLVFQKKYAVKSLNVFQNLQARLHYSKEPLNTKLIEDILEQLELTDFKKRNVNKLSEGQLQRLGIALSVIHNPQLILADEPTSSLDDDNCKAVIELLQKQAQQAGANLIVITHDHRIQSYFQNSMTL